MMQPLGSDALLTVVEEERWDMAATASEHSWAVSIVAGQLPAVKIAVLFTTCLVILVEHGHSIRGLSPELRLAMWSEKDHQNKHL
jgi:hypothetical protein